MTNIEPISILRQAERLDKISQSDVPMFVTKNGKAYLVLMSPGSYDEINNELERFKKAFEREREINALAAKVEKSRQQIAANKCYSEEEFDKIMDDILK